MSLAKRKHILVDYTVQGSLVARALGYWLFCLLSVALMSIVWLILLEHPTTSAEVGRRLWQYQAPALLSSILLLPLVLIDAIRWSNRFAGPLVRIRRAVRQVSYGEKVEPLKFRDGDYWGDFADDFNRVLGKMSAPSRPTLNVLDTACGEMAAPDLTVSQL